MKLRRFLVIVLLVGACGTPAVEPETSESTESTGSTDGPEPEPDEMEGMIRVPEGSFWRGCDPVAVEAWGGDCDDDPNGHIALDVPMAEIQVSEFWIDEYETTVAEYRECETAGACVPVSAIIPGNVSREDQDKLPISNLSWYEAEAYCAWKRKRLPTEAEWEKAARGTDTRQLPWGDDYLTCGIANMLLGELNDSCEEPRQVLPVDAYPDDRSPYGVIGMGGNVKEWVADWKGQLYYTTGPTSDPNGPAEAEEAYPMKIMRGGYHGAGPPATRVSQRSWALPEEHLVRVGVRCARSAAP